MSTHGWTVYVVDNRGGGGTELGAAVVLRGQAGFSVHVQNEYCH